METIFRWLILLLVPFLALSFGAVQKWAVLSMEASVFTLAIVWSLTLLFFKKSNSRLSLPQNHLRLFIAFLPLMLFMLIQAARMPESFISLISHGLLELKKGAGLPDTVSFPSSLSINRYETFAAFLEVAACFLIVILTSIFFRNKERLKTGLYFIFLISFGISLFGIIQYLTWNGKIYWLKPITVGSPFGPFVNHNHFAAFTNMAVLPLLALALYQYKEFVRHREWRTKGGLIIQFFLAIMIMAILLSGSRGGIVGLLAGIIVLILILRREGEVKINMSLVSIVLLSVTALFFIIDRWTVLDTLSSLYAPLEDISLMYRFKGWGVAMQIFKDFPVAGTGFGTFSDIFLLYRPDSMPTTFRHAHNEYIQLLTEGGVLGLFMILIPLAYFFLRFNPLVKDARDSELRYLQSGIFAGIIAVLIHNTVEFNMRVPANAYLFSLMLGLYLAISLKKGEKNVAAHKGLFGGLLVISMVCLVITITDATYSHSFTRKPNRPEFSFSKLQTFIPSDPQDFVKLGEYYADRKMYPEAAEYFSRALEIFPLDAATWSRLAIWSERMGALDEAIKYMEAAVKLDPVNPSYLIYLAGMELKDGETLNSVTELKRLARNRREWLMPILELMAEAGADFEDIIDIADNNPDILLIIGSMFEKEGNYEFAAFAYRNAVKLKPMDEKYLDNYARFIMRRKDYDSLMLIDELFPGKMPARILFWKSEAYIRKGLLDESVELLEALVERDEECLKEYGERLASLFLQMKDYELALTVVEKVIVLNGEDYNRLNLISLAYEGMGKWMKAIDILKKMAVIRPAGFAIHYRLAGLYEKRGIQDLAVRELENCLDIQPDNFKVRLKLGDTYLAMSDADMALYHYRNLLALDPANSTVLSRLDSFSR